MGGWVGGFSTCVEAPVGVEEVDLKDPGSFFPALPEVAPGEKAGQGVS